MPQYKITYFDARSRVECIRLILECAGQKYEQVRYLVFNLSLKIIDYQDQSGLNSKRKILKLN